MNDATDLDGLIAELRAGVPEAVGRLFDLGEAGWDERVGFEEWVDYAALGITANDVPAMAGLFLDPRLDVVERSERDAGWLVVHLPWAMAAVGDAAGLPAVMEGLRLHDASGGDRFGDVLSGDFADLLEAMGSGAWRELMLRIGDASLPEYVFSVAVESAGRLIAALDDGAPGGWSEPLADVLVAGLRSAADAGGGCAPKTTR